MRNLEDVLNQLIELTQEEGFKQQLLDLLSSVRCAAPETMQMWWGEVHECLLNNIDVSSVDSIEDWEYEMLSLFACKSVEELKELIKNQ